MGKVIDFKKGLEDKKAKKFLAGLSDSTKYALVAMDSSNRGRLKKIDKTKGNGRGE